MIQVYGATDIKDTYDGDRREPWDRASSRWDNLHVVSDTVCCSVEREWLQQQSLLLVQCGGHTLHHAGRVCRLQPNGLDDMLVIYMLILCYRAVPQRFYGRGYVQVLSMLGWRPIWAELIGKPPLGWWPLGIRHGTTVMHRTIRSSNAWGYKWRSSCIGIVSI